MHVDGKIYSLTDFKLRLLFLNWLVEKHIQEKMINWTSIAHFNEIFSIIFALFMKICQNCLTLTDTTLQSGID